MRGRPGCLLQSAGGEANRILLSSALSSMRIICPNRVTRRDWIIAVSLGCFVSLCAQWLDNLKPSDDVLCCSTNHQVSELPLTLVAITIQPSSNVHNLYVLFILGTPSPVLKPQWWNSAWGCGPEIPSLVPNFVKICYRDFLLRGKFIPALVANVFQKFHISTILIDLN